MTVEEVRRANFMTLLHQYRDEKHEGREHGSLAAFSRSVAISNIYLSHVKCKRKDLGPQLARRIEQHLRLPKGWMDQTHTAAHDDTERFLRESIMTLFQGAPALAREQMLDALRAKVPMRPKTQQVETA